MLHTWAGWLMQNGMPMYDLQEMGGWKSAEMVRRYAHLAPAQMAKHTEKVGGMLAAQDVVANADVTNATQVQK